MLQVLAALFGAVALGATNLAARRLNAGRLEALAATVWLGMTYAFWTWSTNVAYVSAGAMLAAFAVALLWGRRSIATQVMIGVLAACSALSWQANIFLFPVLIAGICFQAATWDDRLACYFWGDGKIVHVVQIQKGFDEPGWQDSGTPLRQGQDC